ncbi:pyranose dehydrogenase [Mycena galericulata]|nr:pyranose dehydrogenase [Mycena galericulata]
MRLTWTLLILALWLANPCFGKIYEDISDLPGLEYDFVIVGGGAAGNVVANRLTENPNFSVLVLEAGVSLFDESVSNEGVIDSNVPFFENNLLTGPNIYEWNYTTTPQVGLNNRTLPYPRDEFLVTSARGYGMVYTRGSSADYDRYAAVTGDPGWTWDNLLPYFFKNEKWTQPADHHDTHGRIYYVLEATKQLSDEFSFNLDFNSGQMLGVGWLQSTIGGGEQSTSATSYLAPKFVQRESLNVLLHAQVSKLVDSSMTNGELTFGGVEFLQATKEIILSAGSVGTPNILMHSGIGDREALSALGISTLLHLPSVGQNATDQPLVGTAWSVNSTQTADSITENATLFNEAFAVWNETHTGPFVNVPVTHIRWVRLTQDSPIFKNLTDPASGPPTPHIEIAMVSNMFPGLRPLKTTAGGSVTLQSNNPFDPPLIDLGLLKTEFDIFAAREAIKRAYRFVQAPVWQDYIIAPTTDLSDLSTDVLDEFIRNNAQPADHLVSTAAMSARNATYGVVRLSIIDASILPFVPSAHSQAASYVVGERGADLVKQRWQ